MLVSSLFPICFYSVSSGFLCSYVPLLMRLQCLSCKALRVHFPCNVSAMFVHYVSVRFPRSLFIFLGARRNPKSPIGGIRARSLPDRFRFSSGFLPENREHFLKNLRRPKTQLFLGVARHSNEPHHLRCQEDRVSKSVRVACWFAYRVT